VLILLDLPWHADDHGHPPLRNAPARGASFPPAAFMVAHASRRCNGDRQGGGRVH
jgi:hypothetical protein